MVTIYVYGIGSGRTWSSEFVRVEWWEKLKLTGGKSDLTGGSGWRRGRQRVAVIVDRRREPLLEGPLRRPVEIAHLPGVESVPPIVAGTVLDELDAVPRCVEGIEDRARNRDVLPLLAAGHVVCLAGIALSEYGVDRATGVTDERPGADVAPIAVRSISFGISFSSCCRGPNVLEGRTRSTGRSWVTW